MERRLIADSRGFLSRIFCAEELKEVGCSKPMVQMNYTLTRQKGAVRGMHFQYPPHSEIKIITCVHGEILDVAVDIRKGSPTFLRWHGEILSAKNPSSLYIPDGFAHGFQTLTDDCRLLYLHSAMYALDAEGLINALDPMLSIDWPLEITEISERDRNYPLLGSRFEGVEIK